MSNSQGTIISLLNPMHNRWRNHWPRQRTARNDISVGERRGETGSKLWQQLLVISILALGVLSANAALAQTYDEDAVIAGGNYADITVNKDATLTVNDDLTISGTLDVFGTLIVNGDLTIGNNGEIVTRSGAIVVVFGDATLKNKSTLALSSYFIVTGSLSEQSNSGSYTLSVDTAHIYVFDEIDGFDDDEKGILTKCTKDYGGTTETENVDCDAGGYSDFVKNVDPDDKFPDDLFEEIIKHESGNSSAGDDCTGYQFTYTSPDGKVVSLFVNLIDIVPTGSCDEGWYNYQVLVYSKFSNPDGMQMYGSIDLTLTADDRSITTVQISSDVGSHYTLSYVANPTRYESDCETITPIELGYNTVDVKIPTPSFGNGPVEMTYGSDNTAPVIGDLDDVEENVNTDHCTATIPVVFDFDAVTDDGNTVFADPKYRYTIAGIEHSSSAVDGQFTEDFPIDTTTIYWTVEDMCGNTSAEVAQKVIVANPVTITPITCDGTYTEADNGPGMNPIQTSTHTYEVDGGTTEGGYTYTWELLNADASGYVLTGQGTASISLKYASATDTIPAGSYTLKVTKESISGGCKNFESLAVEVVDISLFNVEMDILKDQCQTPNSSTTTYFWTITFPGGFDTEPFSFEYELTFDGTTVLSGTIESITSTATWDWTPASGTAPFVQTSKEAGYKVELRFTFPVSPDNELPIELKLNATDAYLVSVPEITNDFKANKIPVISFD
ncbi:hypothetical protein C8N47_1335 [Mangrovibacterium marinum]|uniref:HYR domain-containing protein n=1 Tax=Mangrovibacterium marinum TaxID=1639118 RepID=A0A2T5BX43_9BACT|nr:hypothetical protein [Mangrovibacterium marinum]PTN04240.1 hypothetical protein C8N47_1335 [Mangrovibacterium marinum]